MPCILFVYKSWWNFFKPGFQIPQVNVLFLIFLHHSVGKTPSTYCSAFIYYRCGVDRAFDAFGNFIPSEIYNRIKRVETHLVLILGTIFVHILF